jgi:hypothetical protein
MSSPNPFASTLMAFLLAAGLFGVAPMANAESGDRSVVKSGKVADVVQTSSRGRGQRLYLPIGPSYRYYDYPYYYSRGYYPTHIGPGFIYYGHPYSYYRSFYLSNKRGPGSPGRQKAHGN